MHSLCRADFGFTNRKCIVSSLYGDRSIINNSETYKARWIGKLDSMRKPATLWSDYSREAALSQKGKRREEKEEKRE